MGISAVISAASAVYGVYSGIKQAGAEEDAAQEAEALAQENARLEESEGQREKQLTREAQEETEAEGRARAAASGIKSEEGSAQIFKTNVKKKHSEALDWMSQATASRSSIIRQGGRNARKEGEARADATRGNAWAGGIASLNKTGTKAGWWS